MWFRSSFSSLAVTLKVGSPRIQQDRDQRRQQIDRLDQFVELRNPRPAIAAVEVVLHHQVDDHVHQRVGGEFAARRDEDLGPEEQVEERRNQEDDARNRKQPEQRARHVGQALRQREAALQRREAEAQDLHHPLRPPRPLADEAGEGRRLQAGDQRLVDIDAVPAAGMELERGLAILGDADAGEAVGFGSAVRRRTAAEPQKKDAFHLSRPRWMMP